MKTRFVRKIEQIHKLDELGINGIVGIGYKHGGFVSSGSVYGPGAVSCEHGNETFKFRKMEAIY
jgi:hypothetical protein